MKLLVKILLLRVSYNSFRARSYCILNEKNEAVVSKEVLLQYLFISLKPIKRVYIHRDNFSIVPRIRTYCIMQGSNIR